MSHIIDLNGNKIEIRDMPLAIMQADDYRHCATLDARQVEFYRKQRVYWEDVYRKLLMLAAGADR